ncbi:MAG: hypothetical protein HY925_06075, partial [Elusimicrobia bacterium]|nr:hypothetical protein [Elusimicrobiota bacterium]
MNPFWLLLAALASAETGFTAADFELTSGELRPAPAAVSVLDAAAPPPPTFASDSPVFRMRTRGAGWGDVEVSVELLDNGLRNEGGNAWDGVHVWLRYQNPAHLYAVSVNRRDDRVVIKKKVPGGDSYGGTYFDLCDTASLAVPYGRWQRVSASAVNQPDGSV